LIYGSEAIEYLERYIEIYQTSLIFGLCVVDLLIFVMLLISIIRVRRLGKQVDKLIPSVERLLNEEWARYTRTIIGRAREKDSP